MQNKKHNLSKKMASVILSLFMATSAIVPSFADNSSRGNRYIHSINKFSESNKITGETKNKLSGLIDELLMKEEIVHRYIGTPFIRTADNRIPFDVYSDSDKLTRDVVQSTSWYLVWQLATHHKVSMAGYTEDKTKSAIRELEEYKKAYAYNVSNDLDKDGFYESTTGDFKVYKVNQVATLNSAEDLYKKTNEENNEIRNLFHNTVQIYKSGNNLDIIFAGKKEKVREIKDLSLNGISSIKVASQIKRPENDELPLISFSIPGEVGADQLVVTYMKYIDANGEEKTINTPFGIDINYGNFLFKSTNPLRRPGEGASKINQWITRGKQISREHMGDGTSVSREINEVVNKLKDFKSTETPEQENLTAMYKIVKPIYEAEYKDTLLEILRGKISQQKASLDDGFYSKDKYTEDSLNKFKELLTTSLENTSNKKLSEIVSNIEKVDSASSTILRYKTDRLESLIAKAEKKNISDYTDDSLALFLAAKKEAKDWVELAKKSKPYDDENKTLFNKLKNVINLLIRKDGTEEEKITENFEDSTEVKDASYFINVSLKENGREADSKLKDFITTKAKYVLSDNGKSKKLYIDLKPIKSGDSYDKALAYFEYTRKGILTQATATQNEVIKMMFIDGEDTIKSLKQVVLDVDGESETVPVSFTYYDKTKSKSSKEYGDVEKLYIDYENMTKENTESEDNSVDKTELNNKYNTAKSKYDEWTSGDKYTEDSLNKIKNILDRIKSKLNDNLTQEEVNGYIGELDLSKLEEKLVNKPKNSMEKIYTVNVIFLNADGSEKESHANQSLVQRAKLVEKDGKNNLTLKLKPMYNNSQPTGVISKIFYYKNNDRTAEKIESKTIKSSKITTSYQNNTREYTYPTEVEMPVDGSTKKVYLHAESASPVFDDQKHGHDVLLNIDYDQKTDGYIEEEADKSDLTALINAINEKYYVSVKDKIKEKVHNSLMDKLNKAKNVQKNIRATEDEVDLAYTNLIEAKQIADLYVNFDNIKKQADANIRSDELSGKFTKESLDNSKKYIDNKYKDAMRELDDNNIKSDKINNLSTELLDKAYELLRYDTSNLEKVIKNAEDKINSGKYDEKSFEELKLGVEKAKKYVEKAKSEKGIDERSKYEKDIEDAEKLLSNKPEDKKQEDKKNDKKQKDKKDDKKQDDKKQDDKKEENKKEEDKKADNLKDISAEIKTDSDKVSTVDSFLKDKKVRAFYNKEKDESTYELTFKKFDGVKKMSTSSNSTESVSKLWYFNKGTYKQAELVKSNDGENTFRFIKSGKIEKEMWIKMSIPAMNGEQTAKLVLNIEETKEEMSIKSIDGENRFSTATKISETLFSKSNDKAVLASGLTPVDALTTSLYAKSINAPILLTKSDEIPKETINEIKRLGVREVSIIGGYNTINRRVEDKIKSMGIEVIRIYGSDRYKTAQELAKKSAIKNNKFVVVNGVNYADAISMSGYCAQNDYKMILSDGINIDDKDMDSIKNADEVIIVGGTSSISKNIENKIGRLVKNTYRISGEDRYETSLQLSNKLYKDSKSILIASGENDKMTDALAGSQLAANKKSPIQLVGNNLSEGQKKFVKENKIKDAVILGGINSVSKLIRDVIKSL